MLNFCPICQKEFKDILKHFALYHEIGDIAQLESQVDLAETQERKRRDYGLFIEEINEKLNRREITIEEWKDKRDKWEKEHR